MLIAVGYIFVSASKPVYTINYLDETVSFDTSTHEMNTASDFTGTSISNGGSIKTYIGVAPASPTSIYIRETSSQTITPIVIPVRPATPSITGRTQSSSIGRIELSQSSVNSGEEYTVDNWANKNTTGNFTGLSNNEEYTIKIRTAATASSFVSEEVTMAPIRTKIVVNTPEGLQGSNVIIIDKGHLENGVNLGATITFTVVYEKTKTPEVKIKENPGAQLMFNKAPNGGERYYRYTPTQADKEITFELKLKDRKLLDATGKPTHKFADNPKYTDQAGLIKMAEDEILLDASYDNETKGKENAEYNLTTGVFNQKVGNYVLTAKKLVNWPLYTPASGSNWASINLEVRAVTANVPATIPNLKVSTKAGGYSTHNEIGLPATITATYTGNGYKTRTEEVPVTWSPAVSGFGAIEETKTFTATPTFPSWATNGSVLTTNVDVTSTAAPLDYKVKYDANGGENAPADAIKIQGVDFTLTSDIPTRERHRFLEWNTSADGTGTSYASGSVYKGDANVTFYAQWQDTFTAVTDITSLPTNAKVGIYVPLKGIVEPANATNKEINYAIKDAGTTDISWWGSGFIANAPGEIVVEAVVLGGTAPNGHYTKEFTIKVDKLDVDFNSITANGDANTATTELLITFDKKLPMLKKEDFTVTGATIKNLTNKDSVYKLEISDITVGNNEEVTVSIAKNGYVFTPSERKVSVNKMLTGTVSISGSLTVAEKLTANIKGTNNTGTLSYQWKRGSVNVGTGQTYTTTTDDIGYNITCEVTSDKEGGLISAKSGLITKKEQNNSGSGSGSSSTVGGTIDYVDINTNTNVPEQNVKPIPPKDVVPTKQENKPVQQNKPQVQEIVRTELTKEEIKLPELSEEPKDFTDMKETHWAKDSIEKLSKAGIISGDDGKFNANEETKRADVTIMLVKLLGLEGEAKTNFSDVDNNKYYANYVGLAREYGIINGAGGKFNPESNISRQDAIVMVAQVLKGLNMNISTEIQNSEEYTDFSNFSGYAKESVAILLNAGVIKGSEGKLNPTKPVTRAEMAVIVSNVYDILEQELQNNN